MKRTFVSFAFLAAISTTVMAQEMAIPDTAHYQPKKSLKLDHAEPLYIDLIRDLGAHKGEKEWNIGAGMTDNLGYDRFVSAIVSQWRYFFRASARYSCRHLNEVPVRSPNWRRC